MNKPLYYLNYKITPYKSVILEFCWSLFKVPRSKLKHEYQVNTTTEVRNTYIDRLSDDLGNKKNEFLHCLGVQWAAVNSVFRPFTSSFEAPSFTEWIPGSWVNFPITFALNPECASTLVLPQNTLASHLFCPFPRQ